MSNVAPLVGARIEIGLPPQYLTSHASLPSWERGLKYEINVYAPINLCVAPLVGARIEIATSSAVATGAVVAPLVGARIEILFTKAIYKPLSGRSPRGSED